jgi:hypothetical protein
VRCMLALLCQQNPDISFKWSFKQDSNRGLKEDPWPVKDKVFAKLVKYLRELVRLVSSNEPG